MSSFGERLDGVVNSMIFSDNIYHTPSDFFHFQVPINVKTQWAPTRELAIYVNQTYNVLCLICLNGIHQGRYQICQARSFQNTFNDIGHGNLVVPHKWVVFITCQPNFSMNFSTNISILYNGHCLKKSENCLFESCQILNNNYFRSLARYAITIFFSTAMVGLQAFVLLLLFSASQSSSAITFNVIRQVVIQRA